MKTEKTSVAFHVGRGERNHFKLALQPFFWVYAVMGRFFNKNKEPKLLSKPYEVTCTCGKKYFEAYLPPKRYINVCDSCLPF